MKQDFLDNLDHVQTLTMDEVQEKLSSKSIILLDLRPVEEFDSGHISGAISAPLEDLESFIQELPRNTEIVAYCRGPLCVYSALAVQKLHAKGYIAYRMEEGLNEWQQHFQDEG